MTCLTGRITHPRMPCNCNKQFWAYLLAILVGCGSVLPQQLFSQSVLPGLKVDCWQMDEGLPVNSIISVAQTADGWLFFGTEEGLVRFNGNSFLLMNKANIPGLAVNFISALAGSRDSSLWIGTEGDGVLCYKNGVFFKYTKKNGLADDRIFALCEDSAGGIWIGTSGGGLNYLNNGNITRYDTSNGLASNYVRSIVTDTSGRVWVGTQQGLSVIDNGKIRSYSIIDGLSDNFIEALALDRDQTLWIGTKGGGLNRLINNSFTVFTINSGLTADAVTSLCFDAKGMLWIGTNGGGITRLFNGKFYPFTSKDGLASDLIVTLFEDREGNIWAGSSGAGINRIKKKTIQTLTEKDGLPGEVILPVLMDHSGALWLGIAGKGLIKMEQGKVKTFSENYGLPDLLVLSVCEDRDSNLWVGTAGGGLSKLVGEKFVTYTVANGLSGNVINAIYCDRSGILWAGTTGGGINKFENGTFTSFTTREGLSDDNVSCILEDRNGCIWIGTNDGLNKIQDNKISTIHQKDGLSDNYILSLYEDKDGNLWVGTASNGFNLIRNGKITPFTTRDGLINEVVLKIIEDDFGNFWISCNKGIYRIRKQDLLDFADSKTKMLQPFSYGKSDGMETIECNGGVFPSGWKTYDGKLLFPTMKGVAIVDPGSMRTASSYFSPVKVEDFLVDGQSVKIGPELTIPSRSIRLEFRYAALNYTVPEKIRYKCMLVGFDKDWVECGTHRSAYYTNIPGGNYTFKVIAASENGMWDDQLFAELSFRLKPDFYLSLPFYLIVGTFLAILIFFIFYFFLERFKRTRLKLLVDERTQELHQKIIAQMETQQELLRTNEELLIAKSRAESGDRLKTAFMNNISHEVRTPLNGIIGFSSLITQPDTTDAEREFYFTHIEKSSARLLNTVNNFMDISLIASGNIEVENDVFDLDLLFKSLEGKYHIQCLAKHLDLVLDISKAGPIMIKSDIRLLRKILSHLLDNAVKFTSEGGVSFGYSVNDPLIEFYVKDTGIGISEKARQFIFDGFRQEDFIHFRGFEGSGLGLTIAHQLVKLLGGEICVETSEGEGSIFSFSLPFH